MASKQALRLRFPAPLIPGVILSRPNRFVMEVLVGTDKVCQCHAACTGKIAGFAYKEMAGLELPCLVSRPQPNAKRKTEYTVEALSLQNMGQVTSWIGINQVASTGYIGHFLAQGALPQLAARPELLQRERKVGDARLDFVYNEQDLIEVKTPLARIPVHTSTNERVQEALLRRQSSKFKAITSASRVGRHLDIMSNDITERKQVFDAAAKLATVQSEGQTSPRAIMVQSYMYDASPFQRPAGPPTTSIGRSVERARLAGVELWQVNMSIDPEGITLLKYFHIANFGSATEQPGTA